MKIFFFYDENNKKEEKSDAWKMIIGLIVSQLTNSSIFLQGCPGSGKSCAARYYGSQRNFQNREPILSINFNKDLEFDKLIGNYSFQDNRFEFIEGPLLTAMKNGEAILFDEFNLCSESILVNLMPIIKSDINDDIYLKDVPEPIKIKQGFLIIATGNLSNEKGRKQIGKYFLDEINLIKIEETKLNKVILNKVMKKNFSNIYQEYSLNDIYKISVEQIIKIFEIVNKVYKVKLSLREIKCLLERVKRFTSGIKQEEKIEIIYIVLSFIIPRFPNNNKEVLDQFLNEILTIYNYKNDEEKNNKLEELSNFINSEVSTIFENEEKYIIKGKIKLKVKLDKNLPQNEMQAYFWIRMTCQYMSGMPSNENLLLIGRTGFKEYILKEWLSPIYKDYEIYYLTKNTEVENLMGVTSLDDEEKLETQKNSFIDDKNKYFK